MPIPYAMLVSIHQPHYLPWAGYFDKIQKADVFFILDTVQFQKNGFMNRNFINSSQGELLLTIPISNDKRIGSTIEKTQINNNINWQKKHFSSINQAYSKSPFFNKFSNDLEIFYTARYGDFSYYCLEMLHFWLEILNIKTKIVLASDLESTGVGSQYILNICKALKADSYLSGPMGREYLLLDNFKDNDVNVIFHNYIAAPYRQNNDIFVPNLSIIDVISNSSTPLDLIKLGSKNE